MQPPPLAGVRVLDFSHVFAGPFCTRNLADLGADVVHVETQSRPDKLGATQEQEDHRSAYAHRNKRSITINLKHEAGRALTLRLAAVADVAVENFSSRVMRNLGLDYETLQPLNPRLIYVSMSGYGHSGPRSSWTSMNMNLQAYSGLMMTTGAEGDPPTAISNSWNDYVGGLHAAVAVIEALAEREETRRGKNIDLSQFECSVGTLGPLVLSSAVNGSAPRRMGNRSSHAAPQGCYPCDGVDQWCTISVQTDQQWRALAEVIGQPSLAREARFGTLIGRMRGHD
ncbi:MAG TPA: CoA transferase, partial [Chloroflexota bacterium]|nr:CoA transferase [Chloroflexota bacterium]